MYANLDQFNPVVKVVIFINMLTNRPVISNFIIKAKLFRYVSAYAEIAQRDLELTSISNYIRLDYRFDTISI